MQTVSTPVRHLQAKTHDKTHKKSLRINTLVQYTWNYRITSCVVEKTNTYKILFGITEGKRKLDELWRKMNFFGPGLVGFCDHGNELSNSKKGQVFF